MLAAHVCVGGGFQHDVAAGILGVEQAEQAIDAWLAAAVQVDEPSSDACQRHPAAHRARYAVGERLLLGLA